MWKTVLRRILILIPQLIVISFGVFLLSHLMPGDALSGRIDPSLDAAAIEAQRERLGLNNPWYVRYIDWFGGMLTGDFGQSFIHRRPVTEIIGERAVNTFWLAIVTLILTYLIAIPLGVLAGRYKGAVLDKSILIYTFIALSLPTLVLSILMILLFAFNLGWFPSGGSVSALIISEGNTLVILMNRIYHMILPAVTGALLGTIGIIFMLRANIIDRTYSEYVLMARSKGVPSKVIFNKHILRNSLIPAASGFSLVLVFQLTGALFIEMMFQYPGMGQLFFSSILMRDSAVINALIIIFSVIAAGGMLLSDIILTIVDPRIRIK
ncbi:MAG: ABC transporter permease [Defluviitaleaceae bacterium]|nr:ABC transporter permease [Defluviitaleaceae bacterium]